jgi:hypothetical protein
MYSCHCDQKWYHLTIILVQGLNNSMAGGITYLCCWHVRKAGTEAAGPARTRQQTLSLGGEAVALAGLYTEPGGQTQVWLFLLLTSLSAHVGCSTTRKDNHRMFNIPHEDRLTLLRN